jgi:hypothetical protein
MLKGHEGWNLIDTRHWQFMPTTIDLSDWVQWVREFENDEAAQAVAEAEEINAEAAGYLDPLDYRRCVCCGLDRCLGERSHDEILHVSFLWPTGTSMTFCRLCGFVESY